MGREKALAELTRLAETTFSTTGNDRVRVSADSIARARQFIEYLPDDIGCWPSSVSLHAGEVCLLFGDIDGLGELTLEFGDGKEVVAELHAYWRVNDGNPRLLGMVRLCAKLRHLSVMGEIA